nr:hypothetical protein [Pseudoclavibacter sp. Marseille-Q3772]
MGRPLALLLTLTSLALPPLDYRSSSASECETGGLLFGACASNSGGSVEVEVTEESDTDNTSPDPDTYTNNNTDTTDANPANPNSHCEALIGNNIQRCLGRIHRPAPAPNEHNPPPLPDRIQRSALANITPQPATLHMEPNGWAIIGRPTNFWTTAQEHTINATVLGHQVTVTFTPTTTDYHYGDGTTQTAHEPGGSWHDLGLPELTDTHTSHRYTTKTQITASATVHYQATVHANGNTIPVTGDITATTTSQQFQLYEVDVHLIKP